MTDMFDDNNWQNDSALLKLAKESEGVVYLQVDENHPYILIASADADLTTKLRRVIRNWEEIQDAEEKLEDAKNAEISR